MSSKVMQRWGRTVSEHDTANNLWLPLTMPRGESSTVLCNRVKLKSRLCEVKYVALLTWKYTCANGWALLAHFCEFTFLARFLWHLARWVCVRSGVDVCPVGLPIPIERRSRGKSDQRHVWLQCPPSLRCLASCRRCWPMPSAGLLCFIFAGVDAN